VQMPASYGVVHIRLDVTIINYSVALAIANSCAIKFRPVAALHSTKFEINLRPPPPLKFRFAIAERSVPSALCAVIKY
jgi:hypothetical protein